MSAASAAATNAASTQSAHAAPEHAARAAPVASQVSREIVRRFEGGSTKFELRLDPPELGRIEVRLEVSRDHRVTAHVVADSPQALSELSRHARDLEQQLQSSGLDLAENGLSFDLRQDGAENAESENNGGRTARAGGGEESSPESAPAVAKPIGLERWRGVRVDVMA